MTTPAEQLKKVNGVPFIFCRRSMAGSLIGGIPEIQEMLDFCRAHNIICDIEMTNIQNVNIAYESVPLKAIASLRSRLASMN